MNNCCNKIILSVLKVDRETDKGLGGALFQLIDSYGAVRFETTPAHGLVRLSLSHCEKYYLKEIRAPRGYERSHKTYEILVDSCGNIYVDGCCCDFIVVKNTPKVTVVSIRYLANGGAGEYAETELPLGTVHTVKELAETGITAPEGKTFVSWNTRADGSGTTYLPHDILTLNRDEILYAQWEEVRTVTVMGLVYPTPFDDHGLGEDFLKGFEIVAELRQTFLTPAGEDLSTIVTILYPEETIGRFAMENVPVGDYVLYIKLDGNLVRCMNVSITEESPDLVLLTPPTGTLFTLWAGDVNNDLVIDSNDIDIITSLQNVRYGETGYIAAADLNFDGIIDANDLAIANANIGKGVADYPGAEDVDFNS